MADFTQDKKRDKKKDLTIPPKWYKTFEWKQTIGWIGMIVCIMVIILNVDVLKSGTPDQWKSVLIAGIAGYVFFSLSKGEKPNIGGVLILVITVSVVFVFLGKSPEDIYKLASAPSSTATPPPREIGWMPWIVSPDPSELLRVYNGDVFIYKSPKEFVIMHEDGQHFTHNPCTSKNPVRQFRISELPPEGGIIQVYSINRLTFDMEFRVSRK